MGARCYFIVGGIFLVISIVMIASINSIYDAIMEGALTLDPDAAIYEAFVVPPVNIYMTFMLFNITNPDKVIHFGEKPILKEVGPYVFLEGREKFDISWNDEEGTVTYKNNHSYEFQPELSVGSLDDEITTLNAVLAVLGNVVSEDKTLRNILYPEIENQMNILETHKAGEILFGGWDMPEYNFDFSFLSKLPGNIGKLFNKTNITNGVSGNLHEVLVQLITNIPGMDDFDMSKLDGLKPNKIGYMYGKNGVDDGWYTIYTGKKDMKQYQYVKEWNLKPKLDFWGDQYCDMINGTDGTQLHPHVKKDEVIYIFASDLCRSLSFEYEKDVEMNGQKLWRFIAPEIEFADYKNNPDNLCYCWPNKDESKCLGAGFINLESAFHVPIIMSTPHFYQGDDMERAKLVGLDPKKELHETIIDIEPRTGLVMNAHKRIQLNMPLKNFANLPAFKNTPEVILPILWLDETGQGTADDIDLLHTALNLPFTIVYSVFGCLLAIGLILVGVGQFKKRKQSQYA